MNNLRIEVLTAELKAHHVGLQRLELALRKGLIIMENAGLGFIVEKYLHLCSVFGRDRRLDVDLCCEIVM